MVILYFVGYYFNMCFLWHSNYIGYILWHMIYSFLFCGT